MTSDERLTLTVPECAKLLGISRGTAFEMVRLGRIPAIRISPRRIVVPKAALEKMLVEVGSRTERG